MTDQQRQQVINFLATNLTYGWSGLPLVRSEPAPPTWQQWSPVTSPTQFAEYALAMSDFRTIGLGGLISVVESRLLEDAVATVVGRTNPAFSIIVSGLKIAAERQRGESWSQIAKSSAVGIGIAAAIIVASKYGGGG